MGREDWFSGLIMVKGRVIDPATITMFGMKELLKNLRIIVGHVYFCTLSR